MGVSIIQEPYRFSVTLTYCHFNPPPLLNENKRFLIFEGTTESLVPSAGTLLTLDSLPYGNDAAGKGERTNSSDVEYGLLIDINGTPFAVEIRPFFHANEQPGIFVASYRVWIKEETGTKNTGKDTKEYKRNAFISTLEKNIRKN